MSNSEVEIQASLLNRCVVYWLEQGSATFSFKEQIQPLFYRKILLGAANRFWQLKSVPTQKRLKQGVNYLN